MSKVGFVCYLSPNMHKSKVFNELDSPSIFCRTSIISGYARNGMVREGVDML